MQKSLVTKVTYTTIVNKKGKNDFAYTIILHYKLLPTPYIILLYYRFSRTISRKISYLQTIIQFKDEST